MKNSKTKIANLSANKPAIKINNQQPININGLVINGSMVVTPHVNRLTLSPYSGISAGVSKEPPC